MVGSGRACAPVGLWGALYGLVGTFPLGGYPVALAGYPVALGAILWPWGLSCGPGVAFW